MSAIISCTRYLQGDICITVYHSIYLVTSLGRKALRRFYDKRLCSGYISYSGADAATTVFSSSNWFSWQWEFEKPFVPVISGH